MGEYTVNLTGFGISDEEIRDLENSPITGLQIIKKGDISNSRLGKTYRENIIRLSNFTTYEIGFSPKIDNFISLIEKNSMVRKAFENCSYVELQIWINILDDETGIPSMHLTSAQMKYLSEINADLDVDIVVMSDDS